MIPAFELSMFYTNWRSFYRTMAENVTSDDLHNHNNDFFLSHVKWHIKWKVMTPVFDLSLFYTNWRSFHLTIPEMWDKKTSLL